MIEQQNTLLYYETNANYCRYSLLQYRNIKYCLKRFITVKL